MTEHSVKHGSFVVERHYPVPPTAVFEAWADGDAKAIWMDDPDYKSNGTAYSQDFRVGGHERFGGLNPDGTPYRYEGRFYDIVPDRRIVYSYQMYEGSDRSSISLTTVEIAAEPDGTRLTYTEQGAFLDGLDKPEGREEGVAFILDGLGKYLASRSQG